MRFVLPLVALKNKPAGERILPFLLLLSLALLQRPLVAQSASGKAPELQAEKDWVDGRWQQSDVGPFLAGNLRLPSSAIPKSLSIRLQDQGGSVQGAITYDTAQAVVRAAWTGGFLKFSPARFGLTDAPKPDGVLLFENHSGIRWAAGTSNPPRVVHRGIHLRGNDVVVEYQVGDSLIREVPSLRRSGSTAVFTRAFTLAATGHGLSVPILQSGDKAPVVDGGGALLGLTIGGQMVWAGVNGGSGIVLKGEPGRIVLHIEPSASVREFEVRLAAVPQSNSGDVAADLQKPFTAATASAVLASADSGRWSAELRTAGTRGQDRDALSVDTITVPYENPWKALFFLSGVDFTSNGDAYVCSIHGDVWRVRGVNDSLQEVFWKRFASGLAQPLGLKVVGDQVYVLGKDQITRLIDSNQDGEAERYENVSNQIQTSTGGHDYVTNLEVDREGRFYYVDHLGVHRISRNGETRETIATGWRNPNGMGLSPDGILTVAPQQGTWTPSSAIFEAKPGGYYGFGGPKNVELKPLGYDEPLCWIPHSVDNSSSSQTWIPKGVWGDLSGRMLHLLWGRCQLMLAFRDDKDGPIQGGVVPLPGRFLSGPMRARFHQGDLYVAGATGWQTSALKDGAFQRVRRTARPLRIPLEARVHQNGLVVRFSDELEASAAADSGSYAIKQWNYRYTSAYGSRDYSVSNPEKEGRDEIEVVSARLLPDRRSVWIETAGLKPVMQMELKYSLNSASGDLITGQFWLTINQPRPAFRPAGAP